MTNMNIYKHMIYGYYGNDKYINMVIMEITNMYKFMTYGYYDNGICINIWSLR